MNWITFHDDFNCSIFILVVQIDTISEIGNLVAINERQ